MPRDPKPPTLKLCQLHEGRLQIPMDIRQLFMQCPIHGPEWREMVTKFDKDWGSTPAPANQSPPPSTPPPTQSSGGEPSPAQVKVETKLEEGFEWSSVFRDSPTTLADLKRKFGDELTEMAGVGTGNSFYLAPTICGCKRSDPCQVHGKPNHLTWCGFMVDRWQGHQIWNQQSRSWDPLRDGIRSYQLCLWGARSPPKTISSHYIPWWHNNTIRNTLD